MDQTDSDTLKSTFGNLIDNRFNLGAIHINKDFTIGIHAACYSEPHLTRQQRVGQVKVQIILLKPRLRSHLDHIAEPFRGDQSRLRSPAFNQRIRGKRGSMNDLVNLSRGYTRLGTHLMHPVDNRIFRGGIGGQNLY